MFAVRYAGRMLGEFVLVGARSGRWWVPLLALGLAVVALLIVALQAVVPAAVYTLL